MNCEINEFSSQNDVEITKWLDDLQQNDAAAEAVWRYFFPRLVGAAEQRMKAMPSKARDEEDVALSAMQSFFAAADAGHFEFKSRDDLWRLLLTITMRKITKERRSQLAQKRGGNIEHIGNHNGDPAKDPIEAIIDPSQMPELVEEVHAECNELLSSLPDEAMKLTARMKLEGCSAEEISDVLRCKLHETKARLAKIRELWRLHIPPRKSQDP